MNVAFIIYSMLMSGTRAGNFDFLLNKSIFFGNLKGDPGTVLICDFFGTRVLSGMGSFGPDYCGWRTIPGKHEYSSIYTRLCFT